MENFTREGFAAAIILQAMPDLMKSGAPSEVVERLITFSVRAANALCDELHNSQPGSYGLNELMEESSQ